MPELTLLQSILLFAVPAIFAITVHEAAHGYAARLFGDRTAEMMGRLTLNPLKHIDPIGTVAIPLALLFMAKMTGGPLILFGWAKPVPVAFRNLKNPRRDGVIVAAAGPASNLAMATGWALVLLLASHLGGGFEMAKLLTYMAYFGVLFNVLLAVFNMLPVPPLDGGRVVTGLLPPRLSVQFAQIERFGLLIVIALLATGVLWKIIGPIVNLLLGLFMALAGA